MKYFFYLLLILFMALASCKKEPTSQPASTDYSKYIGNYYGIISYDAVEFASEVESDRILPSDVSGNQLLFNGVTFSIPSPPPTSFSVGDMYTVGANLNYYSNFEQIGFEQHYDGGITKVDVTFSGNKTALPVTDDTEHPLKSQLEGMFILQIQKREYLNGVDLSYIDTVLISMSGYNPVIDNEEYNVGVFYTYYKSNSMWNQGLEQRDLYWVQDSIYLDYKTVPSGTTDTIHHVYSGKKM